MCFKKETKIENQTVDENKKKKKWPIVLCAVMGVLTSFILFLVQVSIIFYRDAEYVNDFLNSVVTILDDNTDMFSAALSKHKQTCQDITVDIACIFSKNNYNNASVDVLKADSKSLEEIADIVDTRELYIVDENGNIYLCVDNYEFGKNIVTDLNYFTPTEFEKLKEHDFGTMSITYNPENYEETSRIISPLTVYDDETKSYIDYYSFPAYLSQKSIVEFVDSVAAEKAGEINVDETIEETVDDTITEEVVDNETDSPKEETENTEEAVPVKDLSYYVILGENATELINDAKSYADLGVLLDNSSYDDRCFAFAIYKDTKTFAYYKDIMNNDHTGENVLNYLSDEEYEKIKDLNDTAIVYFDGSPYFINVHQYSSLAYPNLTICSATKIAWSDRYKIVLWSSLLFLLLVGLLVVYASFLKNKGYSRRRYFKKIIVFSFACYLILTVLTFYLLTLDSLSITISKSAYNETILESHTKSRAESVKSSSDYYKKQSTKVLKIMAYMYEDNMDLLSNGTDFNNYRYYVNDKGYVTDNNGNKIRSYVNNNYMSYVNSLQSLSDAYIINNNCKTVFTSGDNWYYEISRDPNNETYPYSEVLDRKTDSFYKAYQGESGNNYLSIAVHIKLYSYSEGGVLKFAPYSAYKENPSKYTVNDGVLVGISEGYSENITSEEAILDYAINTVEINGGSTILLIDKEDTTKFVYKPVDLGINNVSDLRLPADVFTSDYTGFTTLENTDYFTCISLYEPSSAYMVSLFPTNELYVTRNRVTSYTALTAAISYFILALILFISEGRHINEAVIIDQGVRLPNQQIPWIRKTPEEKLGTLIKFSVLAIGLVVVIKFFKTLSTGNTQTIMGMLLSDNYRKGINIFSLSACALIIFVVSVIVNIVTTIFGLISSSFGTKSKAFSKLILSIVQYSGIIIAFLYCLYLVGFDMTKIITAVGILTTVVGVGSKTIINDIVAGIFLITEDSFKVGDIVNIGGFRGTVQEIGLRTTSVVDVNNNVKSIANSTIQGVVNMSKNLSTANCSLTLSYDLSLEDVDEIVKSLLPKLREENGNIVGEIRCIFTNLKENGSTLIISAEVFEKDRLEVGNFINRRMLELLGEKNIKVMSTGIVEQNQ